MTKVGDKIKSKTSAKKTNKQTKTDKNKQTSVNIADLEKQLNEAQQSAKDNWQQFLRAQAEGENLKKRHSQELAKAHKFALEKFAKALLDVKDSFQMGLQSGQTGATDVKAIVDGLTLSMKLFDEVLGKFEITSIDPSGGLFDPSEHEAVTLLAVPGKKTNEIVEVVQVGYRLNDRLLRPARVVVAQ